MRVEVRLDCNGREIGVVNLPGKRFAGNLVYCDGLRYRILDVCYEGAQGSAEVEPVKKPATH